MSYSNKPIQINGTTIQPGTSAQLNLNLYQLPTKTAIEIPVYIFRSLNPISDHERIRIAWQEASPVSSPNFLPQPIAGRTM